MRILVTGANGFIGSHLVERLSDMGYEVTALCEYNSYESLGWLDFCASKDSIRCLLGDIRDSGFVRQACVNQDFVLHLASLVEIPYSYRAPRAFMETNVAGTLNVLEAVRESGSRLVHTSTSEVYGTAKESPMTVHHPINPQSPYAASKASSDHFVVSFTKSFGVKSLIVRPFNTYGPRQSVRAIIPSIMTQALIGSTIKVGNTTPKRDFTFVDDTVRAFELILTEKPSFDGTTLQLGFGKNISVSDLINLISHVVGKKLHLQSDQSRERAGTSEVESLLSDNTSASSIIGWVPRVELSEGLSLTWNWLRRTQIPFKSVPGRIHPA